MCRDGLHDCRLIPAQQIRPRNVDIPASELKQSKPIDTVAVATVRCAAVVSLVAGTFVSEITVLVESATIAMNASVANTRNRAESQSEQADILP